MGRFWIGGVWQFVPMLWQCYGKIGAGCDVIDVSINIRVEVSQMLRQKDSVFRGQSPPPSPLPTS